MKQYVNNLYDTSMYVWLLDHPVLCMENMIQTKNFCNAQ